MDEKDPWAKIEIEFLPGKHDINEVMMHLADYFKDPETGVPTATVNLLGFSGSVLVESIEDMAARIWVAYGPNRKINAIKELRAASSLGLKEAKDAIDKAAHDNPTASIMRP